MVHWGNKCKSKIFDNWKIFQTLKVDWLTSCLVHCCGEIFPSPSPQMKFWHLTSAVPPWQIQNFSLTVQNRLLRWNFSNVFGNNIWFRPPHSSSHCQIWKRLAEEFPKGTSQQAKLIIQSRNWRLEFLLKLNLWQWALESSNAWVEIGKVSIYNFCKSCFKCENCFNWIIFFKIGLIKNDCNLAWIMFCPTLCALSATDNLDRFTPIWVISFIRKSLTVLFLRN